jgi:hypothetical protein
MYGDLLSHVRGAHQPVVVDVGAFDGAEALVFAPEAAKVYSFEPTPSKGIPFLIFPPLVRSYSKEDS